MVWPVLFADTPRTLVHYGSSVSRDGLSAHCRPVVEVEVGSDIETFLEAMGFEYVTHTSTVPKLTLH